MVRSAGDPEDVYIGTLFEAKFKASSKKIDKCPTKIMIDNFFRFLCVGFPSMIPLSLKKSQDLFGAKRGIAILRVPIRIG